MNRVATEIEEALAEERADAEQWQWAEPGFVCASERLPEAPDYSLAVAFIAGLSVGLVVGCLMVMP